MGRNLLARRGRTGSVRRDRDGGAAGRRLRRQLGESVGAGPITLHALFMKQAAYSDADVKAMTDAFTDGQPEHHRRPGVRRLRRAPRQDRHRPGRRLRPVRHRPDGRDLAGRVRQGRHRDRHHRQDPGRVQERRLRLRLDGGQLPGQVLRRARGSTTRSSSSSTRRCSPTPASPTPPKTWDDVVTAAKAIKAKGTRQVPARRQLEAGRGGHLRLDAAGGGLRRHRLRRRPGQGPLQHRRRAQGAPVHEAAPRRRPHEPGLAGLHRGRRQQPRCRPARRPWPSTGPTATRS